MIRVPEGMDRGTALYKMYPGAVTQMVLKNKTTWFSSQQYKALRNNCTLMDQYIDKKNPSVATYMSDISPQLIRRGYHEYTALLDKFFENEPMFSIRRNSGIPPESESAIISLLSDNIEKTYYRERCFSWTKDHIVRYGTAVTYTYAVDDFNSNSLLTVKSPDENSYTQQYQEGQPAVISTPIHPLNIIIDPATNFMMPYGFLGILSSICISGMYMLLDNPLYNQNELKEAIEKAKSGYADEHWFSGENKDRKDFTKGEANISYIWTKLPFEGNEDDNRWYAVEEVAGKIIRIEENVLDGNTIPVSISRILPRQYTWYGNSPLCDKIALQNLQHWQINSYIESMARLNDRIVLYSDGDLDATALNSRHTNGGLVPYRGNKTDLSTLMYSPNLGSTAFRENDWLMQFTRREDQDSSAIPNFNPQSEGGPTNKTLGGAQMMASIGEMKMAKYVSDMAIGLKDVAKHQHVMLINMIPDDEPVKPLLLGDVSFSVKTSNVFNYIREGIDAQNRISQLINWLATGRPEFNGIKLDSYIKEWVRATSKREDIDDYYDENMAQPVQSPMPGSPAPAMANQPPQPPQGVMM